MIEAPGLFQNLDRRSRWCSASTRIEGDVKSFLVTYFGVTLGRWKCTRKGGDVSWQT